MPCCVTILSNRGPLLPADWKTRGRRGERFLFLWVRCRLLLHPLFLPLSPRSPPLLFPDAVGPAESSAGCRHNYIQDHLTRTHHIVQTITHTHGGVNRQTVPTSDTTTTTTVSLRFFIHMALARLRLVVLKLTDWRREEVSDALSRVIGTVVVG